MNEVIIKDDIENMIYEVRGKQVMLDSDLAKLYNCKNGTKTINQAVSRHISRFPERFMFQLTEIESSKLLSNLDSRKILWSQIGTAKHMSRSLPYVFTEQGVAMLAAILRTDIAEEISIRIMDAFVMMRKYISNELIEQKYINNLVLKNTDDIRILQQTFDKLEDERVNEIYFEGQIYDAYSKIIDIMNMSKQKLIIIDNYADKSILDMISKVKVEVMLITKGNNLLKKIDIEKYNKQYHNLNIIYDNTFHDRYIIIDNTKIYHCGTSLNHIGSKTFSINLLEDDIVKKALLNKIIKMQ